MFIKKKNDNAKEYRPSFSLSLSHPFSFTHSIEIQSRATKNTTEENIKVAHRNKILRD